MLAITDHLAEEKLASRADGVSILSLATAVPGHIVTQKEVAERARAVWPQFYKLEQLSRTPASNAATPANRRNGTWSGMAGRIARTPSAGMPWTCWNGPPGMR